MDSMPRWLNRNVWGMTITSLLSDACYEMVLAVLPGFLPIIHVAAAALGWIEGASDAFSSFLKLFAGYYSDKIGRRKWMIVLGYLFTGTGLSIFATAVTWVPILLGRMVSWFGKGIRGSLRDAMLSESVDADVRGRAFGFHRAGDTVGAIIGPLAGAALLSFLPASPPDLPFRRIFLLSLIPGLCAPVVFALMVRETRRQPMPGKKLAASIRGFACGVPAIPARRRSVRLRRFFAYAPDAGGRHAAAAGAWHGARRATCGAALCDPQRCLRERVIPDRSSRGPLAKTTPAVGRIFLRRAGGGCNGAAVHKRLRELRGPVRRVRSVGNLRRGAGHARRRDPARSDRARKCAAPSMERSAR